MNLDEIVGNVRAELKPATNIDTLIKRWANRGQSAFLRAAKRDFTWTRWVDLTLTMVSGRREYALSPLLNLGKTIYFTERTMKRRLELISLQEFRSAVPNPTEQTGFPEYAYFVGFSPVELQPTSPSTITFVSTASDTSVIKLEGLSSSGTALIGEEITLNGSTPVVSANTYSRIVSRGVNGFISGTVTMTSNSGAVTNAVISPRNRQGMYPIVGFWPAPAGGETVYYDAFIDLPPLVNGNDFSLMPEKYHDGIEQYCLYRGHRHKADPTMALEAKQGFLEVVAEAVADDRGPQREIIMEDFEPRANRLGRGSLPGNFPRDY